MGATGDARGKAPGGRTGPGHAPRDRAEWGPRGTRAKGARRSMEAAAEALGDNCRKTLSKPFRGSFRLDRSCGGAWITAPRAARPAAGAMAPWGAMGSAGTGGGGGGWIHPGNTAGGNIRDARRNEKTIEGGAAAPPPGGVRQLDRLGRGTAAPPPGGCTAPGRTAGQAPGRAPGPGSCPAGPCPLSRAGRRQSLLARMEGILPPKTLSSRKFGKNFDQMRHLFSGVIRSIKGRPGAGAAFLR